MPENIPISFIIERFTSDLNTLKSEIIEIKKDVKALQISDAKSDVKTGLAWSIITALIMGIVGIFLSSKGVK